MAKMRNMFDEIASNKRQSMIVLIMFFVFSSLVFAIATLLIVSIRSRFDTDKTISSFLFFYPFVVFAIVCYLIYFLTKGDKMILQMTGAKEVSRNHYPHLFHSVEGLSIAAGLKSTPKCYVIEDSALNAFATGFKPEKSYVVVTTGLIKKLSRQEIEGVLAHELAHIKNQDIKLMLYIAGLLGVFTLLGTMCYYMTFFSRSSSKDGDQYKIVTFILWILFALIAPFFTMLFKLYMSRKREYLADATGAMFTRYPKGLASALEKIKNDPDPLVDKANKATAHLFISTPFRKKKFFANAFSTHPPIDERIDRLNHM